MLCFVFGCSHSSESKTCSFFSFPTNPKEREKWEEYCKREDSGPSNSSSRICSCHFVGGDKKNGFLTKDREINLLTLPENKRKLSDNKERQDGPSVNKDEIIKNLKERISVLEQQVEDLTKKLNEKKFGFNQIKDNSNLFQHYTGLIDVAAFSIILNFLQRFTLKYFYDSPVVSLSLEDQLLLFLMKLRHNFTCADLAARFEVSRKVVDNVFITLLHAIHECLFQFVMAKKERIPSVAYLRNRAPQYYSNFPNCRVIVGCMDVNIECTREDMNAHRQLFPHHKQYLCCKALTGVTPDGLLIFASDLYPGLISDRDLFQHSGILDIVKPGELILADKGFTVHDLMPIGVALCIPPLSHNSQFTEAESVLATKWARTRVTVEKGNQRIKKNKILDCISANLTFCY